MIYIQLTGIPFYIPCDYLNWVFPAAVTVVKGGKVRDLLHLLHSAADPVFHWDEIVQFNASAFLLKEKKNKVGCIFL